MSNDNEILVKVDGVSKKFCRDLKKSLWYGMCDVASELLPIQNSKSKIQNSGDALRPGEFWANKDISFELRRGECIGLIGRNGAGKTTLLKMLNGLIKPDEGTIEMRGRVGALIALGAGFNPILTGRENIYVNGSILGLSKEEIDAKMDDIIEFAEIPDFIDSPVQSYSSGMQVRLGFAVATALQPDVLILDEVLAVGDVNFRSKCIKRIGEILSNCAVIFVSHDTYQIHRICDQVIWLKAGQKMYIGDTSTGIKMYSKDGGSKSEIGNTYINSADTISDINFVPELSAKKDDDGHETHEIKISIKFQSIENYKLGFRLGNINSHEEKAIAQFDFSKCFENIKKGSNHCCFKIPNIQLSMGEYTLGFVIFDQTNKKLLINLRNIFHFKVNGNLRYGPECALKAIAVNE
jgi:lipopolysaccharide transport system ATP-binding protein